MTKQKFSTLQGLSKCSPPLLGIDMSLYLVSQLHSQALAQKTANQMEFDWSGPQLLRD